MNFDDCALRLNYLSEAARTFKDKYYGEWCAIHSKEFPPRDEDGNYVPVWIYKHKPSVACEHARQLCLAAEYFQYHVAMAKHDFEQFVRFSKIR